MKLMEKLIARLTGLQPDLEGAAQIEGVEFESALLNLQPGDVVVLSCDGAISQAVAERLKATVESVFGQDSGHKCLVLSDGLKLRVLRPAQAVRANGRTAGDDLREAAEKVLRPHGVDDEEDLLDEDFPRCRECYKPSRALTNGWCDTCAGLIVVR